MWHRFEMCISEHTATNMNIIIIVCLYVDDLLLTRNDEAKLNKSKTMMKQAFKMNELGLIS